MRVLMISLILLSTVDAKEYASFYSKYHNGKIQANGKPYQMWKLTCAHKTLPLECKVKVTNLFNNRSVILRVTDRGPYETGRDIDVSYYAACKLKMIKIGVVPVKIERITDGRKRNNKRISNRKSL